MGAAELALDGLIEVLAVVEEPGRAKSLLVLEDLVALEEPLKDDPGDIRVPRPAQIHVGEQAEAENPPGDGSAHGSVEADSADESSGGVEDVLGGNLHILCDGRDRRPGAVEALLLEILGGCTDALGPLRLGEGEISLPGQTVQLLQHAGAVGEDLHALHRLAGEERPAEVAGQVLSAVHDSAVGGADPPLQPSKVLGAEQVQPVARQVGVLLPQDRDTAVRHAAGVSHGADPGAESHHRAEQQGIVLHLQLLAQVLGDGVGAAERLDEIDDDLLLGTFHVGTVLAPRWVNGLRRESDTWERSAIPTPGDVEGANFPSG